MDISIPNKAYFETETGDTLCLQCALKNMQFVQIRLSDEYAVCIECKREL